MPALNEVTEPILREGDKSDLTWIVTTWSTSFYGLLGQAVIPKEVFYPEHRRLAFELLERSQVRVVQEGKILKSFVIIDLYSPVIHWAYTTKAERRKGHFKSLIADLLDGKTQYTHDTAFARAVARKFGFVYNPFILTKLAHPSSRSSQ